jgi:hypothetical protein
MQLVVASWLPSWSAMPPTRCKVLVIVNVEAIGNQSRTSECIFFAKRHGKAQKASSVVI